MRSFVLCLIIISGVHATAATDTVKSSNVLIEAESSFMRGDLLNANRFYGLATTKTPKALESKDTENIVITKQLALPPQEFLAYCKSHSNLNSLKPENSQIETRFFCAKALIHNEKYVDAVDFIEKIPVSYQRLEYHFLKATLYLKLNKTAQCLDEMTSAQSKVTENTSLHFRDLIQVIHARCLLAEGRYADAVNKFQTLSVNSDFYLTTLEEQAWAHFKSRNLTSARDILKILISYFTGQDIKNQMFGADVYFRTKYLQAYIELISENREKSRQMFSDLKTEIQKFKKDTYAKTTVPKDTEAKLYKIKNYSQLLDKDYNFIGNFRDFMNTWSSTAETKKLDNDLRYLIAVNVEVDTVENLKSSSLETYLSSLKHTQELLVQLVATSMQKYLKESKKNVDSIEFKANMGQVENFWAARTEGKRTLAEVLDTYKKEVTYVEDYLGK
jgi:tetratricopeptide (TPR) repeat protein